jgi:hypothetical protein
VSLTRFEALPDELATVAGNRPGVSLSNRAEDLQTSVKVEPSSQLLQVLFPHLAVAKGR